MYLVVNGVEAFVGTGGRKFDPALPLVVFVHGAGLDHTVWALLTRWFAHHGCGVLAPDLPGHGRSSGEPLASIGAVADWIAALIEASKADRASINQQTEGEFIARFCNTGLELARFLRTGSGIGHGRRFLMANRPSQARAGFRSNMRHAAASGRRATAAAGH